MIMINCSVASGGHKPVTHNKFGGNGQEDKFFKVNHSTVVKLR